MSGRLRGWRALSWADRVGLMLMMLFGLPIVAAFIRVFGYVATRKLLERHSNRAALRVPSSADIESAEGLARLAGIAGRNGPITATCLRQSLLIYWILRRRGFAPELKIGVRKQGDALDAHAWVELETRALGQASLAHSPFTERVA